MSPAETAQQEVQRLAGRIRRLLKEHRRTARQASLALGRNPNLLGRALAGRHPLKMKDVFGLFPWLGLQPRRFFSAAYPVGGEGFAPEARALLRDDRPNAPALLDLFADTLDRQPIPPAEEMVERSCLTLRGLMAEKAVKVRTASRALGLGEDTLPQVLRGTIDLTAWHVFGSLAVLEVAPSRFFAELRRHPGQPLAAGTWPELTQLVTQLLAGVGPDLERQLGEIRARLAKDGETPPSADKR